MRFALETALFVALLAAFPVWGHFQTLRLKARADDLQARSRGYIETIVALWLTAALAAALMGSGALFTTFARPSWIPVAIDLLPIALGMAVGMLVPIVLLRRRKPLAAAKPLSRQLQSLDWFLPVTSEQRRLWILLSLTAGVCEEVLFRGFAIRYLMSAPIGFSLAVALFASAIAFGINHFYQGVTGVVATTLVGIAFGLLYIATGNLLAPIVLHALLDLRVLLLPAPARSEVTAPPQPA